MTPETKAKIEAKYKSFGTDDLEWSERTGFISGASFGHALATEEQAAEIDGLKKLLNHMTYCHDKAVEQRTKVENERDELKKEIVKLKELVEKANELIMPNYPDGGIQQILWLEKYRGSL